MPSRSQAKNTGFWERLELLIRYRKALTIFMVIMVAIGLTHALTAKLYYRSTASVLPPAKDPTSLGSMIPSIGAAAVALGGLLDDDIIMVTTLLESRKLRDLVIDKYDWMDVHEYKYRREAYKRWDEVFKWELAEQGYFSLRIDETSPELAQETMSFIVSELNKMYTEVSTTQARNQREFLEKRLIQNRADLAAAEDSMKTFQEKTGVILMEEQVAATVEALGELHKELVMLEVQEQVADNTLPQGSSDVLSIQQRVSALRAKIKDLNETSDKEAKSYLVAMDTAPEVGVEYFRLMREIEIQGQVLEFLMPYYELAKLQEMKDVGSLYILDPASLPDKKIKPRRAFIVLAWVLFGLIGFYAVLAFREWLRYLDETDPERYGRVSYVLAHLNPIRFFNFSSRRVSSDDED